MRKLLLFTYLLVGITSKLLAQEVIYTANGNRLDNARLTDIADDRITFTVQQSDKLSTYSFQRQNILVAFRKGNFLVIEKLSADQTQAKKELETFLTATAWQDKDFLLRAVPFEVIPAKISYENDAIVNYLTNEGKSASISKGELIAILYNDGRHSLIRDAGEVAQLLATVKKPLVATPQTLSPPANITTTSGTRTDPVPVTPPQPEEPSSSSVTSSTINRVNKLVLSAADYQYYRKKALDKVEEFASYLKIIANKSYSDYERNQAIDQAVSLFMPAATMEVTSKSQPGSRRYPIRTYLTNLKRLNYRSVDIQWTQIEYLKELSQAADGNYYGVITGQQTFVGYGNNTVYSDITQKNVRVKLERYVKTEDGQDEVKWGLLLGSIGVSAQY
ncbi:hypothetical protein HNV11_16085 [Spirosoma taeanense]|uniref:Uncharacterized protein n=1 Tax=Spirosoma taeanense TaxID=2735870 RepID=A0A6M5Y9Y1_9BACT|nr:hypothetical protein [Spirosoma taeanense]QJW90789.1 hypothetical protein HNV11_16085 [Spirosoma taeanense]